MTVFGTCGNCGGAVCIPDGWLCIYPPTPTCASCGAVPVEAHGPVMPMKPAGYRLVYGPPKQSSGGRMN
jgi:hypothetical protein